MYVSCNVPELDIRRVYFCETDAEVFYVCNYLRENNHKNVRVSVRRPRQRDSKYYLIYHNKSTARHAYPL
jgi:hypothetical protein